MCRHSVGCVECAVLLDGEVCVGGISTQCRCHWGRSAVHMGRRWSRPSWWVLPFIFLQLMGRPTPLELGRLSNIVCSVLCYRLCVGFLMCFNYFLWLFCKCCDSWSSSFFLWSHAKTRHCCLAMSTCLSKQLSFCAVNAGLGDSNGRSVPTVVKDIGLVGQVSCGSLHTLVLSADGWTVWSFGDGDGGEWILWLFLTQTHHRSP